MEKVLTQPIKKKKTILGIGHPRTGTGYTSKLLQSMGLKVGHEVMGIDGIVAWQFAADRKPWPYISRETSRDDYDFQITIYNVRNPITSIPSIVYTEEDTLAYRSLAGNFMQTSNLVKNAVRSIIAWDKLALSKNPDFIYRIEDQSEDLYNFLISKGLKVKKPKNIGPQNIRKHPGLSDNIQTQLERLDDELKSQLNDFCERHGYPKMF